MKKNNESIDTNMAIIPCNSRLPINHAEDDGGEDCELPTELAMLLEEEQKEIQPH